MGCTFKKGIFNAVNELILRGPGTFEKHCHALALKLCLEISKKVHYVPVAKRAAKLFFSKL